MKLADDELKRLYQRFVADNRDLERNECPSAQEMCRAAMNEMRRGRKLKLIDHVFSCSECAREYETLRLLYQDERTTADAGVSRLLFGLNYRYLVSAVSLLIVLAGIYLMRPWAVVPTEDV